MSKGRLSGVLVILVFTLHIIGSTNSPTISDLPGWPVSPGYSCTPAVGDIDGDGDLEVVMRNYAWHHDGTLVFGWPVSVNVPSGSSPALADMNGDGVLDVILSTKGISVFSGDGTMLPGWPTHYFPQFVSSPAIGDIDGDGEPEVITGASGDDLAPDLRFRVYAFNADGTAVNGWPIYVGDPVFATPALGDLDGDGDLEVVVPAWISTSKIYAWHGDGTVVSGWPKYIGWGAESSPALGDLDGDGDLEVCIGSNYGYFYVWNGDGTLFPGWPQWTGYLYAGHPSPALGDLDGDGDLEIVHRSSQGRFLNIWHHDGSKMEGWPKKDIGGFMDSPSLADIDGDRDLEILIHGSIRVGWPDEEHRVYAWHHDGSNVVGFPLYTAWRGTHSGITINDLDQDGDIEIIVSAGMVHVWTGFGPYNPAYIPWPTFHHDMARTGLYTVPTLEVYIDIKPGSFPNSINLKSKGVIPVAILTTNDFDATTADPETVLFADAVPVRWTLEDVDFDGDTDMLLYFKTQELNLDETSIEAKLNGENYEGTQIEGTDTVNIVPKGKK